MLHLAGQAPCRFRPLSSNVRPQNHTDLSHERLASLPLVPLGRSNHRVAWCRRRVAHARSAPHARLTPSLLLLARLAAHLRARACRQDQDSPHLRRHWHLGHASSHSHRLPRQPRSNVSSPKHSRACSKGADQQTRSSRRRALLAFRSQWSWFSSAPTSANAARSPLRPNPSLERTSTGMALGPRARVVYHRPRGPSTTPVPAPQLKR